MALDPQGGGGVEGLPVTHHHVLEVREEVFLFDANLSLCVDLQLPVAPVQPLVLPVGTHDHVLFRVDRVPAQVEHLPVPDVAEPLLGHQRHPVPVLYAGLDQPADGLPVVGPYGVGVGRNASYLLETVLRGQPLCQLVGAYLLGPRLLDQQWPQFVALGYSQELNAFCAGGYSIVDDDVVRLPVAVEVEAVGPVFIGLGRINYLGQQPVLGLIVTQQVVDCGQVRQLQVELRVGVGAGLLLEGVYPGLDAAEVKQHHQSQRLLVLHRKVLVLKHPLLLRYALHQLTVPVLVLSLVEDGPDHLAVGVLVGLLAVVGAAFEIWHVEVPSRQPREGVTPTGLVVPHLSQQLSNLAVCNTGNKNITQRSILFKPYRPTFEGWV